MTNITDDTLIPKPEQNHMIVVKGNPEKDNTVKTIGVMTSQSDIKTGVEDIPNIKLDDTNIAGDAKIQYIFVLIPPQIIKSCDCVEIQKGTDYNKNTAILSKIEQIDEETSKYKLKPYDTKGLTANKLHEISDLHDEITQPKIDEEVD